MEDIPADKAVVYEVGTVAEYLEKVEAAEQAHIPIAIESPKATMSGLPTDSVEFPAIRVIVDMWQIVRSCAARPASMREAFGF